MNILSLLSHTGLVAQGVLLTLLVFSVVSWKIVVAKVLSFRAAERQSERFLRAFRGSTNLYGLLDEARECPASPIAALFREGYRELSGVLKSNPGPASLGEAGGEKRGDGITTPPEGIARTLRRASLGEISRLERSLIFLATTGNVTPFVGLFGTVWGIMDAFAGIGMAGSANLGAVAPGIAEALITTAAGLATAIPAVIAYNYFLNRVRQMAASMDLFTLEFLSLAEKLLARTR